MNGFGQSCDTSFVGFGFGVTLVVLLVGAVVAVALAVVAVRRRSWWLPFEDDSVASILPVWGKFAGSI